MSSLTERQKERSREIDMRFYSVRDRIWQNDFHIFWEEGKKNLADYVKNTTHYGTIYQLYQDM